MFVSFGNNSCLPVVQKEAEVTSGYPGEMDAWARDAKLGIYDVDQNWDEIIRLAKEEGEVIVYSASSRMSAVGEAFSKNLS